MQNRFKSPIVWINAIGIIVTLIVFFLPNISGALQAVTVAITALISLFAGLNNPTNPDGF
jgi:uncharacterized membrane protein YgaE (UPF0421/DUF939 family)